MCLLAMSEAFEWTIQEQASQKEALRKQAAIHLGEAQYFEKALEVLGELRKQIEPARADQFSGVEQSFRMQLQLGGEERLFEQYFFVEFFGDDFPEQFAGKRFVVKRREAEPIGDIRADRPEEEVP